MKMLLMIAFALISITSFSQDKVLKDTVIKGTTYKMYVGSRGGKYINMPTKADLKKSYKRYFKK